MLVGAGGVAVVAQQRLREAEHGPRAVVVGAKGEDAAREEGRAPGVVLDPELGEVAVGRDPGLALGDGGARQASEEGQHFFRIEALAERAIHLVLHPVNVGGRALDHESRDTT